MVNYLEKLLCVEVLEKVSRMQRFLRSEPTGIYHQDSEVVKIFLKALHAVLDNLRQITERLSEEDVLGEWERLATMRRLSDIFTSVDRLHAQLQFIYGKWIRPETHVFIKSVLEFIPSNRRPEKINVILSNTYSFLETDLSSYIEDVLIMTDIRMTHQNQTPSIFLPKIERDNPLNWAILVHECGHVDSQGISDVLQRPEIIPTQADSFTTEILRRWVEEIYCDIFATKILGPAYLASFATFALVVAGGGGSEITTETHPPDIVRISIIQEVLKKNNLKVALIDPIFNSTDVSSLFYNAIEERAKLDRQYIRPSLVQPYLQLRLGEFVDAICEQVDQIISLSKQLTIKEFSRIDDLSEQLSKGIPIGSYPDPQHIETAKKKFLKGKIELANLEKAKSAVQESRVLLWEVINAGWLYKINSIYPRAFTLFFGSNKTPIEKNVARWGEELEEIDRLLLKSIESSEIHRLLEER